MSTYVFINYPKPMYNIYEVIDMYKGELDPKLVGEVIAEFRRKKGISQEVMSGLAGIGRTHLSAIERGERKPTLETLYKLSCALDTRMSVVVSEIENRISEP